MALRMIMFQPLFWFTSHSLRVCGFENDKVPAFVLVYQSQSEGLWLGAANNVLPFLASGAEEVENIFAILCRLLYI